MCAKCDNLNFRLRTVAPRGEAVADTAASLCEYKSIQSAGWRCMARNRIGTAFAYKVDASKYVLERTIYDACACLYT